MNLINNLHVNKLLQNLNQDKNKLTISDKLRSAHEIIQYTKNISRDVSPYLLAEIANAAFHFRTVISDNDEKVYLYRQGVYTSKPFFIEDLIDKIYPKYRNHWLPDIMRHIRATAKQIKLTDIHQGNALVPCKNLIFNRKTGQTEDYTPDYFLQSKIDTDYPTSKDLSSIKGTTIKDLVTNTSQVSSQILGLTIPEFIKRFFTEISNYHNDTKKQLWQEIIDALEPNLNRGKCVINHGHGGCGKSSLTKLILFIVGEGNFASVDINQLHDNNNVATLLGKNVSIGDDLSDEAKLFSNANFKKLVTGGNLTINRKWEQPFSTTLNLTLIQNENHFAKIAGGAGALLSRRLLFINFDHHFKEDHQNYLPQTDLYQIFQSHEVREYVLYKALHQPQFEQYLVTDRSKQLLSNFLHQNNPVQVFYEEFKDYHLERISRQLVYDAWDEFAHDNGFKNLNRTNFYNRFKEVAKDYHHQKVVLNQGHLDKIEPFLKDMNVELAERNKLRAGHSYHSYVMD